MLERVGKSEPLIVRSALANKSLVATGVFSKKIIIVISVRLFADEDSDVVLTSHEVAQAIKSEFPRSQFDWTGCDEWHESKRKELLSLNAPAVILESHGRLLGNMFKATIPLEDHMNSFVTVLCIDPMEFSVSVKSDDMRSQLSEIASRLAGRLEYLHG